MRIPNQSRPVFRGNSAAAILSDGVAASWGFNPGKWICRAKCVAKGGLCAAGCGTNPFCLAKCAATTAACIARC